MPAVGVRWTIGDVSDEGFEALRLSVWGAWRLFGRDAQYVVCVNSAPASVAAARTGTLPAGVTWRATGRSDIPPFLARHLDGNLAEGVGWKFAPLTLFPDRFSLALDNDCILWSLPGAVAEWLRGSDREQCLIAADVRPCFGQFAALAGDQPRNSGIRGIPPGFDLRGALFRTLRQHPVTLASELDEQGLQIAAVSAGCAPLVVSTDNVSICSPFPPHQPGLGRCGAHFVGLNARELPWALEGRSASELIREHWRRLRPELHARLGLAVTGRTSLADIH
jgi:hypothetical protein